MSDQQRGRTRFVRPLENEETTESIIGAFYVVYNGLKPHLAEELYRNALIIELTRRGHTVRRELGIDVYYRGQRIGFYRVDLIVDDKVLLELKATRQLREADFEQTQNYLRLSHLRTGLLLHFGSRPRFNRFYSDDDKTEIVSRLRPSSVIRVRRGSSPMHGSYQGRAVPE